MDIVFRITTLSSKVYSVDKEVKQILIEYKDLEFNDDESVRKGSNQGEFSYYQDCFTLAFREKEWRRVPSNTLAAGDIIRLLPGEIAPAMLKRVQIIHGKVVKYELEGSNV